MALDGEKKRKKKGHRNRKVVRMETIGGKKANTTEMKKLSEKVHKKRCRKVKERTRKEVDGGKLRIIIQWIS